MLRLIYDLENFSDLLFVLKNYHIIVIITLGLLLILIVLSVFNLSKSKKLSEKILDILLETFTILKTN